MAKQQNNGSITVLGEETCFEGYLEYTNSLVVTGRFEGTIKSEGKLEIAKTAECEVDEMSASSILIAGSVKGNINARDSLEIRSGSKIAGDIKTRKLRIADNVDYQGAVTMLEEPQELDVFSVSTSEFKEQLRNSGSDAEPAETM